MCFVLFEILIFLFCILVLYFPHCHRTVTMRCWVLCAVCWYYCCCSDVPVLYLYIRDTLYRHQYLWRSDGVAVSNPAEADDLSVEHAIMFMADGIRLVFSEKKTYKNIGVHIGTDPIGCDPKRSRCQPWIWAPAWQRVRNVSEQKPPKIGIINYAAVLLLVLVTFFSTFR